MFQRYKHKYDIIKTKIIWDFAKDNIKDFNYYKTTRTTFSLFLSCFCLIVFIVSIVICNLERVSMESILTLTYLQTNNRELILSEEEFIEITKKYENNAVHSKQLYLVGTDGASFTVFLEGSTISVNIKDEIGFPFSQKMGVKLIDFSKNNNYGYLSLFDNILLEKYNENVIKYGQPITDKKQVLLAEQFLDIFGISADNVLGKPISFMLNNIDISAIGQGVILDDDNIERNEYHENQQLNTLYQLDAINIFQDYEVVGIINSKYFQEYANIFNASGHLENNPDSYIWMSLENFSESYDGKYLPYINESEGKFILTYNSFDIVSLSQQVTAEGYVFIPAFNYFALKPGYEASMTTQFFNGKYCYYVELSLKKVQHIHAFLNDYREIIKKRNIINKDNLEGYINAGILSESARMNMRLYDNYRFAVNVLCFVGGLLGIIFLINFIRIIDFNVKKRENNLTMLIAMGLEHKDISKLLIFELFFTLIAAVTITIIQFTLIFVIVIVIFYAITSLGEIFILPSLFISYAISIVASLFMFVGIIMIYNLLSRRKYKEM